MRRFLIGIAIVAIAATVLPGTGSIASASASPSAGWVVGCGFSHRSMDDPIVSPGMAGMAHSHDFFGNQTTSADSTLTSLLGRPTTCSLGDDAAAYWAPTLYVHGGAVTPSKASIYYRTQVEGSAVRPFPSGLKMIAGDSHATGPQPIDIVYYNCHAGPDQHHDATPYDCGSDTVDAHVRFPQCWDGINLDSPDHKSHMAYPTSSHGTRVCPSSHPVVLPRLIIRISWPISSGDGVTLASGAAYTLHGDFFNAWNEGTLGKLTQDCINAGIDCGKQSGGATSPPPSPTPSPSPSPSSSPSPSPSPSPTPDPGNLVANPRFEGGTGGWAASRKTNLSLTLHGLGKGDAVRLRYLGRPGGRCSLTDRPNTVATTAAGLYRASIWVRGAQGGGQVRLLLVERDSGGRVAVSASKIRLAGRWKEIIVRHGVSEPGISSLSLMVIQPNANKGTCFLADDAAIVLDAA